MSTASASLAILIALIGLATTPPVAADTLFFSTGDPDGKMATASRPSSAGKFEIESADDFVLAGTTSISGATFTGLLTGNMFVGEVRVEIYRVFPKESNVGRTSGPPTFSTPEVPTRVNSPSDVEFADRDTASSSLTFLTADLGSFAAANSVTPGGIHPLPGETTGGDGAITGEEVEFDVNFTQPFTLPADHYFFVPQVQVMDPSGDFYWLSAPKPIVAPGTPFSPDLQSWTRDDGLAPDWLRVGADIVGAGTFNATFSLTGALVPEPPSWAMMLIGFAALGFASRKASRRLFPDV